MDSEPLLPLLRRGWTFCFFVPVKDGEVLASATVIPPSPRSRTTISIVLRWAGFTFTGLALVDSGAEGSFIDERWAIEQGIRLCPRWQGTFFCSSHHLSGDFYRLRKSKRDYFFFCFPVPLYPDCSRASLADPA